MSARGHKTLLCISHSSLVISCTQSSTACAVRCSPFHSAPSIAEAGVMPVCTSPVFSPAPVCLPAAQYNASTWSWKVGRQKGCAGTGRYPCNALCCNRHPSNPTFSETREKNIRVRPKALWNFSYLLLSNFFLKELLLILTLYLFYLLQNFNSPSRKEICLPRSLEI